MERGRDTQQGQPRPASGASSGGDEERLVRAIANGDGDALGVLYDRYAPSMLAVAQRVLGSAREAEDLVHDVFLEAWHRARHYEPTRGTVRTWLMMRLRSRAIDRQRTAQRNLRVDRELTFLADRNDPVSEAPTPSDAGALRGFLLELSAEHQVVLELAYFSGLSCAEIATRLEVPVGTVKSRMSRAIAQLRERVLSAQGAQP